MFNPLSLFSSLKSGVITIAVIAMLTLTGTLWFQKNHAEGQLVNLRVENSNLKAEVLNKSVENEGLRVTLNVLQETVKDLDKAKESVAKINEDITNAPVEDNGPVAPVLRNTLDSLDRLLHPNGQ